MNMRTLHSDEMLNELLVSVIQRHEMTHDKRKAILQEVVPSIEDVVRQVLSDPTCRLSTS